jgi:hypothetical protein
MTELKGSKSLLSSKTVHGNILSILATVGSLAAIASGGVAAPVLYTAVAAAGGSIWGNIMSILGRKSASERIK